MQRIITQAAIQTREDSTNKLERLFPVLVAEVISRIEEVKLQETFPRIDFWNTYGLKTEAQFYKSAYAPDRNAYIDNLIGLRQNILMDKFGLSIENRITLKDDDKNIHEYVTQLLKALFKKGVLIIEEIKVVFCQVCNLIIAPENVKPEKCKKCGQSRFAVKQEELLMIKVTAVEKEKWLQANTSSSVNKVLFDFTNNAPEKIVISKQRDFGISLEYFNLDSSLKLDPKVTLALQGAIYREIYGIEDCTLVQGIDSIKNTLPLAIALDENFNTKYLPVGYLPNVDLSLINGEDPGFIMPFMAISAAGMSSSINLNQFNALKRQFQKTRIKIQNCLKLCELLDSNVLRDNTYSSDTLKNALKLSQDPQKMMDSVRKIVYDVISGSYLPKVKKGLLKPSLNFLDDLAQINKLFYGQVT